MCGQVLGDSPQRTRSTPRKAKAKAGKSWWVRQGEAVETRRLVVEAEAEQAREKRRMRYLRGAGRPAAIERAGEVLPWIGMCVGGLVAIGGIIADEAADAEAVYEAYRLGKMATADALAGGEALWGIGLGVKIALTAYLVGMGLEALGGIWGALERISRLNVETSKRRNRKRQTTGPQIAQMAQIEQKQESA